MNDKLDLPLLKKQLIAIFRKHNITKFEVIFDHADDVCGLRENYSDMESINNFEARKFYLLSKSVIQHLN